MTVNELIKKLQNLSEDKKELPIVTVCPNGLEVEPKIKLGYPCYDGTTYINRTEKINRLVITC